MIIDARLLTNMIASGIHAAGEALGEPIDVTVHENAATVYVRTRDRLFRVVIMQPFPGTPEMIGSGVPHA